MQKNSKRYSGRYPQQYIVLFYIGKIAKNVKGIAIEPHLVVVVVIGGIVNIRREPMLPIQESEHAVTELPLGTMFEGFDFENENFMFGVYWGSCNELVKADIDFPRIPGCEPYGDFRHITSEQILKEKPDNVRMVTVIYNGWTTGAILQYGNYTEDGWVMLGRLYGFA